MIQQDSLTGLINVFILMAIVVSFVGIGYVMKRVIDRYRRNREVPNLIRLDVMVLSAMHGLVVPWFALVGVLLALQISALPVDLRNYADRLVAALLSVSITLVATRTIALLVRHYVVKVEPLNQVIGVMERIGQITVWTIGLMVTLGYLGVPITPLLTTLGVGGLATALALQDTLANFFAGFYILADRPIRVGDYIKLGTGEEGYVTEIGWRSAKIRTLPNNIVIIPNQKLSQSIITNYHLPEQRMSLLVPVAVSYDSDPVRVENVLVDVAKVASQEIQGMLSDPEPFVRFIPGFGEYSLDFTLICQVKEFVDQYYVQHELRKRILARFRDEGIEIPFPIRTLRLDERSVERQSSYIPSLEITNQ